MFIVFGPEMSASEALQSLKRLTKAIMKDGLLIGRDETGEYASEAAISDASTQKAPT